MAVTPVSVTFGWQLDSRQGPLQESRFGAPMVGRFGLLRMRPARSTSLAVPVARARQDLVAFGRSCRTMRRAARWPP